MVSEKHDTNTWRLIQIQVPLFVCYFLYVLPVILSSTVIGEGIDLFGTLWFYWWVDFIPEVGNEDTPMFFYPIWEGFFCSYGKQFGRCLSLHPISKNIRFSKLSTILCVVSVSSQFNRLTTLVFPV